MGQHAHLQIPDFSGKIYGTVHCSPDGEWLLQADPEIAAVARTFLGVRAGTGGKVRFRAGSRGVENLLWFMQKYPLMPEPREAFDAAVARARRMAKARDFDIVPSGQADTLLTKPLFPYQDLDASMMAAAERLLLANDTGLGKTVEALAAVTRCDAWPALIVCPPHIVTQWVGAIKRWTDQDAFRIRGMRSHSLPITAAFVVVHYGLLSAWSKVLAEHKFQAVVFDEVAELRHGGTQKYTAAVAISKSSARCWGLSATPIYGYGQEIYRVMSAIDPGCLGTKTAFEEDWCERFDTRRLRNPEALRSWLLRERLMIQRRREDPEVNQGLPPKRRILIRLDFDGDKYRQLMVKAVELAAKAKSMATGFDRSAIVAQAEQASRRAAGLAKVDAAIAWINTLVEAGERIVVGAHHLDVHAAIQQSLGPKCVRVTGRESPDEKALAVKRFSEKEAPVILVALRAATGIDGLQKAATCVAMVELDWAPAVHGQLEDRALRYGYEGPAVSMPCYYLVAESTFDTIVSEALAIKEDQFVGLMDAPASSVDAEQALASERFEQLIAALAN